MEATNTNVAVEIGVETLPLTIEVAKHYSRMATLKGDRDPTTLKGRHRIGWLFNILQNGMFHSPVWSDVVVGSERGKKYRVDGGHSSTMLVAAGEYFPEDMKVTIRHFRAPDIDAAIDLYAQFNSKRSTRTAADLIKNKAAYVPELTGIAPTAIGFAASGIAYYMKLIYPGDVEEFIDTMEYIQHYPDFIKWASGFCGPRLLRKNSTMGAMYATWCKNQTSSKTFWKLVFEQSGETPNCPTRILNDFLRTMQLSRTAEIKWPPRAVFVKCIHAWNAWRTDKKTRLHYNKRSPLPKIL